MSSDGLARQKVLTGVSIAFTSLSVLIVSLRLYTRTFIARSIGKDDYAMLAGLVLVLGYLATILVLRENGTGYSGKYLTVDQMTTMAKTALAIEVIYYLCVNSIKISILLFYLRITINEITKKLCKGTIVFLATFCTISVIVCFTQCIPLHKVWDITGMVKAKCINTTAFFYMTSSTNIIVDIWILLLPVEALMRMQRPKREKTALICIFALGTLSCIASIIRLYTIRLYTLSTDPFVDAIPINTWSMVEINAGIYCACMPALKALFSRAKRDLTRRRDGHFYLSDGGEGGEVASIKDYTTS